MRQANLGCSYEDGQRASHGIYLGKGEMAKIQPQGRKEGDENEEKKKEEKEKETKKEAEERDAVT